MGTASAHDITVMATVIFGAIGAFAALTASVLVLFFRRPRPRGAAFWLGGAVISGGALGLLATMSQSDLAPMLAANIITSLAVGFAVTFLAPAPKP